MGEHGGDTARLDRIIRNKDMHMIRAATAGRTVSLATAAEILLVILEKEPATYRRAAGRWYSRLAVEPARRLDPSPAVSWDGLARVAMALRDLPDEPIEARLEIAEVLTDAGLREAARAFAPAEASR